MFLAVSASAIDQTPSELAALYNRAEEEAAA